jgi:hypothetical protein
MLAFANLAPADGSSAGAAAAVSTPTSSTDAAGLMELDKDSFQAYIDAAGDKLVVVDFFTDVSECLQAWDFSYALQAAPAVGHLFGVCSEAGGRGLLHRRECTVLQLFSCAVVRPVVLTHCKQHGL